MSRLSNRQDFAATRRWVDPDGTTGYSGGIYHSELRCEKTIVGAQWHRHWFIGHIYSDARNPRAQQYIVDRNGCIRRCSPIGQLMLRVRQSKKQRIAARNEAKEVAK